MQEFDIKRAKKAVRQNKANKWERRLSSAVKWSLIPFMISVVTGMGVALSSGKAFATQVGPTVASLLIAGGLFTVAAPLILLFGSMIAIGMGKDKNEVAKELEHAKEKGLVDENNNLIKNNEKQKEVGFADENVEQKQREEVNAEPIYEEAEEETINLEQEEKEVDEIEEKEEQEEKEEIEEIEEARTDESIIKIDEEVKEKEVKEEEVKEEETIEEEDELIF